MSRLNELIQRLCPNGVEFKKLGAILDYEQPTKYIVKSTDYNDLYPTPVLTAGQTFILGHTNETTGIYVATKDNPTIIFDDFTTSFHWVDFNFKIKSSAMKMLRPKVPDVSFRFIYYAMKCINYEPVDHSRHWISKYSQFEIPLPPLDVQNEIVRILDTFTSHAAELQAELQARKEQYEYYRNKLLTFDKDDKNVKWMKLGEIGNICMCKRIMKSQTNSIKGIPFYKIGTFGKKADAYISPELYNEYKNKYSFPKKGEVLMSASGTIGRTVIYDGKDAYFQDSNIVWVQNDESVVLNKYLYYYYQIIEWNVEGGTIQRLYNTNLAKTIIAVPVLSEQQHIVSILDKFEALVNDLTAGIPAEIAAVQEQYEYYRNKLLTFKDVGTYHGASST